MTATLKQQLDELAALAADNCKTRGQSLVLANEDASRPLMLWLHFLLKNKLTGTADCLLEGTVSAVREAAASLALGLVRPALTSLRLQVDLALTWLYFKDHPVEWARVQQTGEGFKLKTEVLKYLGEHHSRFRDRLGILRDCKTRSQEDPYRLLSAHIHAQSEIVIPQVKSPADIVASTQLQDEFVKLQAECAEFMSDLFWSIYADRWAALDDELRNPLNARFTSPEQRAQFFSQ